MQEIIQVWFQELFSSFYDFFDVFFGFFTFFGEELFFVILIPILYWTINKRIAMMVSCAGILSLSINGVFKDIAQIERPISNENIRFVEIDNLFVNTVDLKDSYSFPSGHAQLVSTLICSLGFSLKNKRFWILGSILIVLVCLSRVYLGVHWPLDVLVGGILGLVLAYGMYKLFIKLEDKRIFIYLGLIVIGFILLLFAQTADTYKALGGIIGFSLGAIFEMKLVNFNPKEGVLWKKVVRVVLGLIILLGLKEGLKYGFSLISDNYIFHVIRYFLLTFVGIGLYPWFFKKIKL